MPLSFTIEADDLARLAKILKQEENGKELRKELSANLRRASEPARDAARSNIMQMSTGGLPHEGEPLREAIARRIVTEARLTGRSTGAKVKVKRKGMPRGFEHAAKRTNRQNWRHPVFGNRNVWVTQIGRPRWFDDAMRANAAQWRRAIADAMNHTAERIARKVRR